MATNDPHSPVAPVAKPPISAEDAELFASRIRPSWELIDDSIRNDIAADLAGDGSSPQSAPADTIIEGVPTVVIGPAEPEAPVTRIVADELPAKALDPLAAAALAKPAEGAVVPAKPAGTPGKVAATVPDPAAQPRPAALTKGAAPSPAGSKTRVGLGSQPDAAKAAPRQAVQVARAAPSSPGRTAPAAVAVEEEIEIPGTGMPKGLMVKLGLAAAALIALAGVGYAAFGGSKKPVDTVPTAVTTPTTPAAPFPTIPPIPPEPVATAAATPTTATAAATPTTTIPTAAAAPTTSPKPSAEAGQPAAPPTAVVAPKKLPKSGTSPTPAAKKGGGGIIRETPF